MKQLTEMRVGLIIAIATILFGVFVGYQAWLGQSIYTLNGQIGTVTADTSDTKTTTHEILSVLLNKTSISSSVATQ